MHMFAGGFPESACVHGHPAANFPIRKCEAMGEIEGRPLDGKVRSTLRWISFELDEYDHLYVRTLWGTKIITDAERAATILRELSHMYRSMPEPQVGQERE